MGKIIKQWNWNGIYLVKKLMNLEFLYHIGILPNNTIGMYINT